MNKQIMNRPPEDVSYGRGLNDCYINIWEGDEVYHRFYEQGIWKENNICGELEEIEWVPEKDKMYKCWWFSTNPADPADPGEDILLYVEEWNTYTAKPNIRSQIIDKLYEMKDDKLLSLAKILGLDIN